MIYIREHICERSLTETLNHENSGFCTSLSENSVWRAYVVVPPSWETVHFTGCPLKACTNTPRNRKMGFLYSDQLQ